MPAPSGALALVRAEEAGREVLLHPYGYGMKPPNDCISV
jgi:hypothetical protein